MSGAHTGFFIGRSAGDLVHLTRSDFWIKRLVKQKPKEVRQRDIPHVPVPEQHANGVDDGRLAEPDDDAEPVVVVNGVPCEATVEIVVDCVTVEQRRLHLAAYHLRTVPQARHVLIHSCTAHHRSMSASNTAALTSRMSLNGTSKTGTIGHPLP